jgi:hypothetical protein
MLFPSTGMCSINLMSQCGYVLATLAHPKLFFVHIESAKAISQNPFVFRHMQRLSPESSLGSYRSHTEYADKLRKRAGECRMLAELAQGQLGSGSYLKLADAYDVLAQEEEKLSLQYPK